MSLGVFHGEGWGLSVQALVIMMALLGTLPLGHGGWLGKICEKIGSA
jgi:hypothetical protein